MGAPGPQNGSTGIIYFPAFHYGRSSLIEIWKMAMGLKLNASKSLRKSISNPLVFWPPMPV